MTSNRFFVQKKDVNFPRVTLQGDEHHHLSQVARIKVKSQVWLFDEDGTNYLVRVDKIERSLTNLFILERIQGKKVLSQIMLAQAMLKSKAQEVVLQKGTELGMAKFLPLISARSVVRNKENIEKKKDRWEKIIREAAKQCGLTFLPGLMPPLTLSQLLKKPSPAKKIFLYEKEGQLLREHVLVKEIPKSVILLIGPEGGWTNQEAQDILEHGYEAVSLGRHILRSETAALSALSILAHFWIE